MALFDHLLGEQGRIYLASWQVRGFGLRSLRPVNGTRRGRLLSRTPCPGEEDPEPAFLVELGA